MNKVGLVIGGILLALVVIGFGMYVTTSNTEISLRTQAAAQQTKNEVIYDKVWKVIQQVAGVAMEYKSAFKDIYHDVMAERYQGDSKQAPLFKWIQEQQPNFSPEMYLKVDDAIQAERAEFAMVQARLLDIKREHQNLRKQFPSCIFVGGRTELDIKIVTSTKTEKTFATGKEDDVNLFAKSTGVGK